MRAVAEEIVRGVDLVHLQLARLDALVPSVPKHPLYVDLVDALSLSTLRRARRTRAPLRFLLEIEARRIRKVEEAILRRADGAAVVSEADANALGAPDHLSVVPLGVDGEAFPFDGSPREGHTVAFTGNLGYFANVDAVTWFAQTVWPLVRAGVPDSRLELIGARPHRAVKRLAAASPGVALIGAVPDMGTALRSAAVAVAPLLAGAGQQIKVLEAMASGTPVVATSIVAQGLGAASRAILVADDPADFARQVIALLTDRPRAQAQAAAAARQIQESHTWSGSARLLEAAWSAARQRFEAKPRR
jgi:glycosyltransferase involved in cell wall biosynthesis